MCPWCRPSVDACFASGGILSSTIQLHRFEQRDAQAAKVRNVSKVGRRLCFQAIAFFRIRVVYGSQIKIAVWFVQFPYGP